AGSERNPHRRAGGVDGEGDAAVGLVGGPAVVHERVGDADGPGGGQGARADVIPAAHRHAGAGVDLALEAVVGVDVAVQPDARAHGGGQRDHLEAQEDPALGVVAVLEL